MIDRHPKTQALLVSLVLLWLLPLRSHADPSEFTPSLFHFVPTVPDRGEGKGGGWQEAVTRLNFIDVRHLVPKTWWCRVTVGMPLRTKMAGKISPDYAAQVTADIATVAAPITMRLRAEWMAADFCKRFRDTMLDQFETHYKALGARVEAL
jgi:hypothetical protein